MDERFRSIAAVAAEQCAVVSVGQLEAAGVTAALRWKWQQRGVIERVGVRTFALAGSSGSWNRSLFVACLDAEGRGFIAGRSAARLMHLDGFDEGEPEVLMERTARGKAVAGITRTTTRPIPPSDLQWIDGLRVVRAERVIIDAPLFRFDRREIENAIDSAIRLRLVSEQRVRTRVIAEHRSGLNGSRALIDAMVDAGGESRLERWFLRLCRESGLPKPVTQKTYRADGRTIARVDAEFPGGLVIELAGHGTHSSRRQRQADEERRTLLTLRGKRVITFTYDDVRYRPEWVAARIREAIRAVA